MDFNRPLDKSSGARQSRIEAVVSNGVDMKVLQILILVFTLSVFASAQKAILTGTVYDPSGAVIPKTKISAKNEKGVTIETETNDDGVYVLNLPCLYQGIEKYEIAVEHFGFEKFVLKDFNFVSVGKMYLDIALDVRANSGPCNDGDVLCL
jgi:hypothetical protein